MSLGRCEPLNLACALPFNSSREYAQNQVWSSLGLCCKPLWTCSLHEKQVRHRNCRIPHRNWNGGQYAIAEHHTGRSCKQARVAYVRFSGVQQETNAVHTETMVPDSALQTHDQHAKALTVLQSATAASRYRICASHVSTASSSAAACLCTFCSSELCSSQLQPESSSA